MSNIIKSSKLVSVIVPVYNTSPDLIDQTISSIVNQTFDKRDFEIIIVDDCSNKKETLDFLEKMEKKRIFRGIDFKLIRHEKNLWLAQSRITGAKNANGKYVVFLDSDDMISADYLKKAYLLLETASTAGWVYPNVRKFGYFNYYDGATDFNAYKLFFYNYCATASFYRKSAWLQVYQREKFVTKNIRFFEDWDTIIRLMARGWYGLPLNDSEFLYRQHYNSLIVRSPKLYALSIYITWRSNFFSFFKLINSQMNHYSNYKKGFYGKSGINFLNYFLNKGLSNLLNHFTKLFGQEYKGNFITIKTFTDSVIRPKKFIKDFLDINKTITLSEVLCGFYEKPLINFDKRIDKTYCNDTILFAHPWWKMGGAEGVLLNWMNITNSLNVKIIDLVCESSNMDDRADIFLNNSALKDDFFKYSNEQYSLDKIARTPLQKLKFCWNLIKKDKPKIIFISSNCFLYALLPIIKKKFPDIKIVDILHNEELFNPMWFGISDEYKKYIDKRIVISDFWKEVLIKKYGESEEKIEVCKNYIDVNKFDSKRFNKGNLKKFFKLSLDKFIIGFFGRLDNQKNPLVFLELVNLFKNDDRFEFIMVGGPGLDDETLKIIKERLKFLPNIKYFGYQKDVSRFMSVCDLIVFPSKYEGYPLVGLEAAAMNIPIIATDIVGFREQIELGKFGILYPQKNIISDAKIIQILILENLDIFKKIGKNGRKFVMKYHNPIQCSKKYEQVIKSLFEF